MPIGEVCDETGTPQSEALWGEEEQQNERTATNRSGEGYEACDDDERTKAGENVIAAKAWQERLSLKRQKQGNRERANLLSAQYG